jgi:hypothetical protein
MNTPYGGACLAALTYRPRELRVSGKQWTRLVKCEQDDASGWDGDSTYSIGLNADPCRRVDAASIPLGV